MQTTSLQKTKAHTTEGKCRNQRVLCNTDRHGGKKVHKNSRPFEKNTQCSQYSIVITRDL